MEKQIPDSSRLYAVTWCGGSDGKVETVSLDDLKGEDYSLPESFLGELRELQFGESLVYHNVTQAVAFMRLSEDTIMEVERD